LSDKLSPADHLEKLRAITQLLLSLDATTVFPNGWTLRELYIHLWSWDDQMIKGCRAKFAGKWSEFKFDHQVKGISYEKWNDLILEEKQALSLAEARSLFQTTRTEAIAIYEKVISEPETIDDEKNFFRKEHVATLWQHDKHHLEQGNIPVNL